MSLEPYGMLMGEEKLEGLIYKLFFLVTTIGRDERCNIRMPGIYQFISGLHCEIRKKPRSEETKIIGLGAGTYLNDTLIKEKEEYKLNEGQVIGITSPKNGFLLRYFPTYEAKLVAENVHTLNRLDFSTKGSDNYVDYWCNYFTGEMITTQNEYKGRLQFIIEREQLGIIKANTLPKNISKFAQGIISKSISEYNSRKIKRD